MKVSASLLAELRGFHADWVKRRDAWKHRSAWQRRETKRMVIRAVVGWTVGLVYTPVVFLISVLVFEWMANLHLGRSLLGDIFNIIRNVAVVSFGLGALLVGIAGLISLEEWIADNVTGGNEMIYVVQGDHTVGTLYVSGKVHRSINDTRYIEIDSGNRIVARGSVEAVSKAAPAIAIAQGLIDSKDWRYEPPYECPYVITQGDEEVTPQA